MKKFILNNILYITGAALGALAGYIYWKEIGCVNGTCSITSRPLNSIFYFALIGALFFGLFKKSPVKRNP